MRTCTDNHLGKLLHDYEMGWLTNDERERFELHLMDCRSCFEELREFKHAARLLAEDDSIRGIVAEGAKVRSPTRSWISKLRELFWPEGPLVLRPAFAYLALLALLPLAYMGLFRSASTETTVRPAQLVNVVTTRGSLVTVKAEPGHDLVLNFAFAGAVPGQDYRVILETDKQGILYANERFRFDPQQLARLIIPSSLVNDGGYTLIIDDPTDPSVLGKDTLRFEVRR